MMKGKIVFICTALSGMMLASCTSGFNENQIKSSFAVLSDTHVDGLETTTAGKFVSALEQLREEALKLDSDGLDAVLIAGDLVNNPYSSEENYVQVDYFKELYESVFNPVKVPLVYTPGNHDVYREWTERAISEAQNISERLGEEYFLTDQDMDAKRNLECRHCKIDDCDVVCILPVGRNPVVYSPEQLAWFDATLSEITADEPNRFVLVLTHPMVTGTVYGSMLGDYWATEALTPILEKYPQAVIFGGHLHFPLNDPRSIWQGSFTALGCGSVRYMAIENGAYEYMSGKTVMKNSGQFSQGLLVQIDRKGNMRITRMDFFNKSTIGTPWEISHPSKDLSFLKKYTTEKRESANTAPELTEMEVISGDVAEDGTTAISVRFPSGKDDEFVHHYVLTLTSETGEVLREKKYLTDFYLVPETSMMKTIWDEPLASIPAGRYTVTLTAYDSWNLQSNILEQTVTIE